MALQNSTTTAATAVTAEAPAPAQPAPAPAPAAIEPLPTDDVVEADDEEDADSTYGSASGNSDTTSIHSAISRGIVQNGRRYQAMREGEYWAPSDEAQFESMNLGHLVMQVMDVEEENPFFRSPISDKAQHILDIGVGDASWAIDVADRFPNLTVHGVDLFPPPESWVPPNCILEVDDVTERWTWSNKWDLIHLRWMMGSFTEQGWKNLYAQAYEKLQPGGWIEQLEPSPCNVSDDGSLPKDSLLANWGDYFLKAGELSGRPMNILDTMKSSIEAAGFINVHEKLYKAPFGSWPKHPVYKDAGRLNEAQFKTGAEGYAIHLFTSVLGWEPEAVQVYLVKVRKELEEKGWHKYHHVRRVWAQKPFETKTEVAATA